MLWYIIIEYDTIIRTAARAHAADGGAGPPTEIPESIITIHESVFACNSFA